MPKFIVLIYSLFIFNSLSVALDVKYCTDVYKGKIYTEEYVQVFKKDLKYKRYLSTSQISQQEFDRSSLYIGINNRGHVYLIADDLRFDGDLLFRYTIKEKRKFSEGIIFKLSSTDDDLATIVKQHLLQNGGPRTMSCSQSICRILNSDNTSIEIGLNILNSLTPNNLLKSLVKRHINFDNNLKHEFYIVGDKSFDDIIKNSNNMAIDGVFTTGYALSVPAVVSFILYMYYQNN